MKRVAKWIPLLIVALIAVWVEYGDIQSRKQTANTISSLQSHRGQAIEYKDLPIGHYIVETVLEDYPVVVIRDFAWPPTIVPAHHRLVYGMMPKMMEKGYIFTIGGTQ